MTDAEIIWLVNPAAKEGKDYQIDRLTALWDITMREDKWIVENNHQGILCGGGYVPGRYATHEVGRGSPGAFIKWYMTDVVPAAQSQSALQNVVRTFGPPPRAGLKACTTSGFATCSEKRV